eukprot:scaffold72230_cov18-Tisochrysis_lutea.AAC.1
MGERTLLLTKKWVGEFLHPPMLFHFAAHHATGGNFHQREVCWGQACGQGQCGEQGGCIHAACSRLLTKTLTSSCLVKLSQCYIFLAVSSSAIYGMQGWVSKLLLACPPPACLQGDQLKKGQTLGYVEQLGTYVPVEAPQAGEVVDFLVEEGAPVEYKQTIVEMAPFFGGHIIGDSKYA